MQDVHLSLFTGDISILGASVDGADGGYSIIAAAFIVQVTS